MKFYEIIALSAIISGCILFGLMQRPRTPRPPKWVLEREIRVIDVESLEIFEVTIGEYEYKFTIDLETSFRMTPDGRMIAVPVKCKSGGGWTVPVAETTNHCDDYDWDFYDELYWDYKCPRCGGYVYRDPEDVGGDELYGKGASGIVADRR